MVFDDRYFERREYDPWQAYGQSKTASVLLAVEATRRWADDGIVANALMPGWIMTGLKRHLSQEVRRLAAGADEGGVTFETTQQGAATSLVEAVAPGLACTGGHYLEDCNEPETVAHDAEVSSGAREWALDAEAAERLWEVSTRLVG